MPNVIEISVAWGDTDAGGLIYFPQFFHFFVIGLNTYFEPFQPHLMDYLRTNNKVLPAVDCSASFSSPLRAGETERVETAVTETGTSSMTCVFNVVRVEDDIEVAIGRVTFVLVDQNFEAVPLPDAVVQCVRERGDL